MASYKPPADLSKLAPAWQWDAKGDISSTEAALKQLPPAWMTGGSPSPAPVVTLPPSPPPTVSIPLPASPIPGVIALPPMPMPIPIPVPTSIPTLPPVVLGPATPVVVPLPQPPTAQPPATQTSTDSLRTAVVGALAAIARDLSNSQFQAWANDPSDIFALVRSESGWKPNAVKNEGFSTKLARDYFSFGLFQTNELFGRDRYVGAPDAIGPNNAKQMVPFPATVPWTKEAAAAALLPLPS